jgi:phospholipase D1/2
LHFQQGVHIYVILYREVEAVLSDLASKRAKEDFTRIHANIHVLRHPNHISINPFESALYWSHHDKVVVVDQKLAFVGGIDLAPGRYDTSSHMLHDVDGAVWPDGDYYNPGVKAALASRAEK